MGWYRIPQLALPLDADEQELRRRALKALHIESRALGQVLIERKSVDARDKRVVRLVYGLRVEVDERINARRPPAGAVPVPPEQAYPAPLPRRTFPERPVVVGTGPAGLFAALILAEAGTRPLVLERGDPVAERDRTLRGFLAGADLDPESNIQFGEGGAGTYSDGKLGTQVRDERGRNFKVIRELIAAGAPEEIAYLAKPHVGTDRLVRVVAALRRRITTLGAEFRFRTRLDSLELAGGRLAGLIVNAGERIPADTLVLAPGHSARDTFAMLSTFPVELEPKAFALGLRIEHPQEMISRAQYGPSWRHPALGPADYKTAARTADGRGVYSFCMCPGGTVVNAASESGGVVCNGMSDFARDGPNANAAIVVSVSPGDFGGGLFDGIAFQRRWEQAAYAAAGGGYALPVQLLADFKDGRVSAALGAVVPSAGRAWRFADLNHCLPAFAARGILEGIARFGRTIDGFDRPDAVLTGVETRTSSPLRIKRDHNCCSSLPGLYPAGEGAGYAGGIMSAAMDGIRVAEAVLGILSPV